MEREREREREKWERSKTKRLRLVKNCYIPLLSFTKIYFKWVFSPYNICTFSLVLLLILVFIFFLCGMLLNLLLWIKSSCIKTKIQGRGLSLSQQFGIYSLFCFSEGWNVSFHASYPTQLFDFFIWDSQWCSRLLKWKW